MKKIILTFALIFSSYLTINAQSVAEDAYKAMTECQCREIIMISTKVEKTYTATWLEGIVFENGYIIFSKGETKHSWNASKITFLEKGNGFIRVYID